MTLNKIIISYKVYVPELIKTEHLPCGLLCIERKSDYCVQNAPEGAMHKEGVFLLENRHK